MTHDWTMGLLGGLAMGVGCVLLVLFNGRILGVSGLLGGALRINRDAAWRWAFIMGMITAGAVVHLLYPAGFVVHLDRSWPVNLAGGLLVGAGTQLGSGCTSGHGICGMGRLSTRSVVATMVFMVGGAVSVFVTQHLLGGA